MDKYITVKKGIAVSNPTLDTSIKSRTSWIGNVTRHRCKLIFVLRNVSKADETTYGCKVIVDGLDKRNGPVNLFVHGKSHYEEDLITVCVAFNFALLKWSVSVRVKLYVISVQ